MQSVALAKQTLPPFRPNVLRAGWLKDLETKWCGGQGDRLWGAFVAGGGGGITWGLARGRARPSLYST